MNPLKRIPFQPEGPQPLVRDYGEPEQYPLEALGPLRNAVHAIASATEAPTEVCAGSVLAVASLATQGLCNVETLGGVRPISLFLLTIAASGERKSTADRHAMKGVRAFEQELRSSYATEHESWCVDLSIWEKRRAGILKTADEDHDAARAHLRALGERPNPPIKPYVVASSPTIEGITKHLPELRACLGLMSEEGGAFLGGHSMKRENRLSTFATLAEMWDGSPLDRWRAGDGVDRHEGRRFSSHLLVQPTAAEDLLSDQIANGQGILTRFLTCHARSNIGSRTRIGRDARAEAEIDCFAAHIRRLLSRPLPLADKKRNELDPPVVRSTPEAEYLLTEFARAIEKAQATDAELESARAFASKAAEHAARIAAVMTMFEDPDTKEITGTTMRNAVSVAAYYVNEAVRLTDAAVVPQAIADAERLRKWLLNSWPEDCITASIAAQSGPFKVTEKNRKLLQLLEKHRWVVREAGAPVKGTVRGEAWRIARDQVQ